MFFSCDFIFMVIMLNTHPWKAGVHPCIGFHFTGPSTFSLPRSALLNPGEHAADQKPKALLLPLAVVVGCFVCACFQMLLQLWRWWKQLKDFCRVKLFPDWTGSALSRWRQKQFRCVYTCSEIIASKQTSCSTCSWSRLDQPSWELRAACLFTIMCEC